MSLTAGTPGLYEEDFAAIAAEAQENPPTSEEVGYTGADSDADRPEDPGYIGVPPASTDHDGTVDTTMAGNEHESADAVNDGFGTGDPEPEPDPEPDPAPEPEPDPEPDPQVTGASAPGPEGTYDPDEHTVTEVKQYFLTASPEEIERVKEAERNGQNRSGIANYS